MDALSRLTQILYMDSSHKYAVAKTMDAQTIDQIYTMKNQMSSNASILPINDNVSKKYEEPKYAVAGLFRDNEREVITGVVPQETAKVVTMHVPSAQKMKTNIFAASIRNIVQWSLADRFASSAKTKSTPLVSEAVIIPMDEPKYTGNVRPFKRKTLTLAI